MHFFTLNYKKNQRKLVRRATDSHGTSWGAMAISDEGEAFNRKETFGRNSGFQSVLDITTVCSIENTTINRDQVER